MDSINSVTSTTQGEQVAASAAKKLGRDDFLKLFLTQLRNQDPLNPMDYQAFSAQLAQFSSLEQLFNVNENLTSLKDSQDENSRFAALDFIGKVISAEGEELALEEGKSATGSFSLDEPASCVITITDEEGNAVRRIPLGGLGIGEHAFEWDGKDQMGNMMDPGVYGFTVAAVSEDGGAVTAKTRITGQVSRIKIDGGSAMLFVGDVPVGVSQVIEIKVPGAADQS